MKDVTFDSNGDIVLVGYFSGSLNTGAGTVNSSGNTDVLVIKTNDNGDAIWAVSAGGTGVDRANAVASDNNGNTYITGYFQSNATFGTINVSGQGWEAYVAKIDVNGNFVWVETFGGPSGDIGHGIAVDNGNNVICVGEYKGTGTFGPDVLTSQANSYDVFITKLDQNGNFLWTEDGNAPLDDKAVSVTVGSSNEIYVIGQFSNDITFQNTHSTTLLNAGFLVSLDQNGNELWFDHMWGTQVLLTDVKWQNNKVMLTGDFRSNMLLDDNNGVQNFSGVEEYNVFAARFSETGALDWLTANYSTDEVHARQITLDPSNNIYITGYFNCTFTEMNDFYGNSTFMSLGFEDIHYIKYDFNGAFQWARQMASSDPDISNSIAIKTADLPVITGTHEGTFYVPAGSSFNFLLGQQVDYNENNCGDANYGLFAEESSVGQRDIFWTSPYDVTRAPFDFFMKNLGLSCDLDVYPPCIGTVVTFNDCLDTLEGCEPLSATLNDFFLGNIEPDYNVSWSNGGSSSTTTFSNSGTFTATLTTSDQCYTWTDDIYINLYPNPDPPLISDSWGFNFENTITNTIDSCDADSVFIWASPFAQGDSVYWLNGDPFNDTTILVDYSGTYTAQAVNQYGCLSAPNEIEVIINNFALHDTLDPDLVFTNTSVQMTDSVLVCNLPFCSAAFVFDSAFTNVYGTLPNLYSVWYIDGVFVDTLDHNSDDSLYLSQPTNFNYCLSDTGWHYFTAHLVNECGDTVDYIMNDSLYLDTVPKPSLLVSGPPFACPNDTVTVYATYNTDTAYWSGANIIANYGDSIQVVFSEQTGINISVTVDTTVKGVTCSAGGNYILAPIPTPQVTVDPIDGVVCPGDSVLLTVDSGIAWQWIGPTGDSLGTNQTQYASDIGEYFCYVTTANNCLVPSEFVSTIAYSSPTLFVNNPTICNGDSTLLEILGPSNTQVTWLSPLSGSGFTQYADTTGYFYVETTFCGITKIDSAYIEIIWPLEGFTLEPDTVICPYDNLVIHGPPGMTEYYWNGIVGTDAFTVVDSGSYVLNVVDPNGCADTSESIYIGYHALPPPPVATDTTICPFGDAILNAVGTGTIDWYTSTGTYLQSGAQYAVNNVSAAVNYLVTQSDAFCTSIPDTASILIFPDTIVASFNILDVCGSLEVTVQTTGTPNITYNWDMGDATTYTGDPITHTYAGNGTYTIILETLDPVCGFIDSAEQDVTVYGQSIDTMFSQPTCYQFSDASLTLDLIDGVGGELFTILDSLGNTLNVGGSNTANNLDAGWYYWFVELGPGCTLSDSVLIPEPPPLNADITVYPPLCYGLTGSVTVDTVYNSQGDYGNISFHWNPNTSGVGGVWADSTYDMPAGDYVLTINDDFGCSNNIDFEVTQPPPLILTQFGTEPAQCRIFEYQNGNGVVYAAASGGTADYEYYWLNLDNGDTSINSTWGGLNPADYAITVTDANGCVLSDTIKLDSLNPIADYVMSSVDFEVEWEGDAPLTVHFENASQFFSDTNDQNSDTTFYWHFDHPNDPPGWVISHDYNQTFDTVYSVGTYEICLIAVNKNGCADTTCKVIVVHDPVKLNPVNVFTPDGDGVNDEFTFKWVSEGIEIFECVIVNRWGVTVHEIYDIADGWNGEDKNGDPCPDGVYFYVYRGTGFNEKEFEGQGSITLIRGE